MSPGSVKLGRAASATLAARPSPVSSMPPHQTGTPLRLAEVVDAARLEIAAHPAGLDVDDAAGAERDCVLGRSSRGDRLVEADRRAEEARQLGMSADVVLGQRLLDQEQVELVELRQLRSVGQGVGGVGVDLQEDLREALANRADRLDVVPGLDLELDAAVALREIAADDLDELGRILVDADRDAAVDGGTHGSEVLGQRDAGDPKLGVEDGHLERRLRHRMTVERPEELRDLVRGDVAGLEETRQQVTAQDVLGAVGVLRGVERSGHRDALTPAFGLGADDADEQDVSLLFDAERHPERRDHREC